MAFLTLLPLGILQLHHSVDVGYWDARSLAFVTSDPNTMLEWLRLPGDVVFIGGGVLPLLWLSLQGVLAVVRGRTVEGTEHDNDLQLFTQVEGHEPFEATAAGALADSRELRGWLRRGVRRGAAAPFLRVIQAGTGQHLAVEEPGAGRLPRPGT